MENKTKNFFEVQSPLAQKIIIQGNTIDDSDVYLYDEVVKKIKPKKNQYDINKLQYNNIDTKSHYKRRSVNIPRLFIDNKLVKSHQQTDFQEKLKEAKELFQEIKPIKKMKSKTIQLKESSCLDKTDIKHQKKFVKKNKTKKSNTKIKPTAKNSRKQKQNVQNKLVAKSQKLTKQSIRTISKKTMKSNKKNSKINDEKVLKFCSKINKKHFDSLLDQMQKRKVKSLQ